MPFSIDTSAERRVLRRAAADPVQNAPSIDLLVRLEMVAIGDRVLAARARAAGRPRTTRAFVDLPRTPVTRARITGMSCGAPAAGRALRASRNARTRSHLRRQDLDQEHVGPARRQLERELLQQVGLQRADADDEEAADADGEQDDARLVAGARQVEDGVAQREPAGARHRPHGADDAGRRPGAARSAMPANPRADDQRRCAATPPATPAIATSAAPTRTAAATCVQSMCASRARMPGDRPPGGIARGPGQPGGGAAAQEQQRLDAADFEQRDQREQQRDQQPDAHPLPRPPTPSAHTSSRRTRRRCSPGSPRAPARASATPSTLPASPRKTTCST